MSKREIDVADIIVSGQVVRVSTSEAKRAYYVSFGGGAGQVSVQVPYHVSLRNVVLEEGAEVSLLCEAIVLRTGLYLVAIAVRDGLIAFAGESPTPVSAGVPLAAEGTDSF